MGRRRSRSRSKGRRRKRGKGDDSIFKLIICGVPLNWYILIPVSVVSTLYCLWLAYSIQSQLRMVEGQCSLMYKILPQIKRIDPNRDVLAQVPVTPKPTPGALTELQLRVLRVKYMVKTVLVVSQNTDITNALWLALTLKKLSVLYTKGMEKDETYLHMEEAPDLQFTIHLVKVYLSDMGSETNYRATLIYYLYRGDPDAEELNVIESLQLLNLASLVNDRDFSQVIGYEVVAKVAMLEPTDTIEEEELGPLFKLGRKLAVAMLAMEGQQASSYSIGGVSAGLSMDDESIQESLKDLIGLAEELSKHEGPHPSIAELTDQILKITKKEPAPEYPPEVLREYGVRSTMAVSDTEDVGSDSWIKDMSKKLSDVLPAVFGNAGRRKRAASSYTAQVVSAKQSTPETVALTYLVFEGNAVNFDRVIDNDRALNAMESFPAERFSEALEHEVFANEPAGFMAVHGAWSEWGAYAACTTTCGYGVTTRKRSCNNPSPNEGGSHCKGSEVETSMCKDNPYCPDAFHDGVWTEWSEPSPCNPSCGTGVRTRIRSCSAPPPMNGGLDCEGYSVEVVEECNDLPICPVDGGWSPWLEWAPCIKNCGTSTKTRNRMCTYPLPVGDGADCVGDNSQTQICFGDPCPIDGGWSEWTLTGECSTSCEEGRQQRTRICDNPAPFLTGSYCIGDDTDYISCMEAPQCPIHGGWAEWSQWGSCAATCGDSFQYRSRTCTNPSPDLGGDHCMGTSEDSFTCRMRDCPIKGGWTEWGEWGECKRDCGDSTKVRRRTCTSPSPANGGDECDGEGREETTCSGPPCPPVHAVDGGWSSWTESPGCSVTCGDGRTTMTRVCNQPTPEGAGLPCPGDETELTICVRPMCPVHGSWSRWSVLDECSATCGDARQTYSRACVNPEPAYGGEICPGDHQKVETCVLPVCPVDGRWTDWGKWEPCLKACEKSTRTRRRKCANPAPKGTGKQCEGSSSQTQECNGPICPVDGNWGEWSELTATSATCGVSYRSRTRKCDNPTPIGTGQYCVGQEMETYTMLDSAVKPPCPVHGKWTEWSDWSDCTEECGALSTHARTRYCTDPMPSNGGDPCEGIDREITSCARPCPVDGGWSEWSAFGPCSSTCGSDSGKARTRTCSNPYPLGDGAKCPGEPIEVVSCGVPKCPVDGGWNRWNKWADCSVSCGDHGVRSRTRECTVPPPINGGKNCPGESSEEKSCFVDCALKLDPGEWSHWSKWSSCSMTCGPHSIRRRTRACPEASCGEGLPTQTAKCLTSPCKTVGGWGHWGGWTACSEQCGEGLRTRTRRCESPSLGCPGGMSQERACLLQICSDSYPIWMAWSEWSRCSATCGRDAEKTRERNCTSPRMTGTEGRRHSICGRKNTQLKYCNYMDCPGGWSQWEHWSQCSGTCDGLATRNRTCYMANLGCPGDAVESDYCGFRCPEYGGWSNWSPWSSCNYTCGETIHRNRTRSCVRDDRPCPGGTIQKNHCGLPPCTDTWGEWGPLSECSKSCGEGGTQVRERICKNMVRGCHGKSEEILICNIVACPGHWKPWSEWGSCSGTCNAMAIQTRNRECDTPDNACIGESSETQHCGDTCAIDGGWSDWAEFWSPCSVTCRSGVKSRIRTCTNPRPTGSGSPCEGDSVQTMTCITASSCDAPVKGHWGQWLPWGECTPTCGQGYRYRKRNCDDPAPSNGGDKCKGIDQTAQECYLTAPCPIHGGWSDWYTLRECSVPCRGVGTILYERSCDNPIPARGGKDCEGNATEPRECDTSAVPCPIHGGWSEWENKGCSAVGCGGGVSTEGRTCTNPKPQFEGRKCRGNSTREGLRCYAAQKFCPGCESDMNSHYNVFFKTFIEKQRIRVPSRPGEEIVIMMNMRFPQDSIVYEMKYFAAQGQNKTQFVYVSFWEPEKQMPNAEQELFTLQKKFGFETKPGNGTKVMRVTVKSGWRVGIHYKAQQRPMDFGNNPNNKGVIARYEKNSLYMPGYSVRPDDPQDLMYWGYFWDNGWKPGQRLRLLKNEKKYFLTLSIKFNCY